MIKNKKLKMDTEIYVVFIILISISVFNAIYSAIKITRNREVATEVLKVDIPTVEYLEKMNLLVTRSKMFTTNWIYLHSDHADKDSLQSLQSIEYPALKKNINTLMADWKNVRDRARMNLIFSSFDDLILSEKKIMASLTGFDDYNDPMKKFSAEELLEDEVMPKSSAMMMQLKSFITDKRNQEEIMSAEMFTSYNKLMWSVLTVAILVILIVVVAVVYMSNAVIVPIMRMKNFILMMSKGEIQEFVFKHRKNAVGQMTAAVGELAHGLKRTAAFANEIGKGNFNVSFQPLSEKDEFGNALLRMRESLQSAEEENRQRNFIATGVAHINKVLQSNNDNLEKLSDDIISTLVKYLGAVHGGIFLIDQTNAKQTFAELKGAYAGGTQITLQKKYMPGEGLIGQTIKDKEIIHLKNIESEYSIVNAGIGNIKISDVIIVPVTVHSEVYGVIEIASCKEFQQDEISFIEKIGESMASTIENTRANELTRKLLEESTKQAERLSAQEEQLKRNNEELSGQSKMLIASEKELMQQQEELQQSNSELTEKARLLEEQNDKLEQAREAIAIKARELELNSKYKSEFLANMSHELRTPLNSVLILAKLLEENKTQNLSDKQREHARIIHKSGSDLLTLINDILDLSKIEAGKLDMHFEQYDLATITGDLRSLFNELANQKKVNFTTAIDTQLPQRIICDRLRVEQVLKNLLSNAFKFTPQGGNISLKVFQCGTDTRFTNTNLLKSRGIIGFSVTDSGIGIPPEKQKLIFEAFQQADGSTSRKYGGTGLGLSISRELVAIMGGEIQLSSEEGKGSTFTFYLPTEGMEMLKPAVEKVIPQYENKNETKEIPEIVSFDDLSYKENEIADDRENLTEDDRVVLIVEDDLNFAKILFDYAHERNYKAVVATQGNTGISYANTIQPDAIILDMQLPGVDGWTILNKLKSNEDLKNIPVHVISGMDRKKLGMEMGAATYHNKPVDKRDIEITFDKISQHLNEARKILILEDDIIQFEIMRKFILSKVENAVCIFAKRGQEAMLAMANNKFDCVIIDLGLGLDDMAGAEILKRIKEHHAYSSIPVIIHTGKKLTGEQLEELKLLTTSIIFKSEDSPTMLIGEINNLFERKNKTGSIIETNSDSYSESNKTTSRQSLKGKNVLLVDDDMRNIYALTNVLEAHEMNVICAGNGIEALKMLGENNQIEMILMDIMMPEMDGYTAMQEIRKNPAHGQLPIIALTAKAMQGDREKCLAAGASDYISKPINTEQLISLMGVWLYNES